MTLRRYLIAGIVFWLPIIITLWVIHFLVALFDHALKLLPSAMQPEYLLGMHIPGIGFIVAVFLVLLTGLVMSNFIGRRISNLGDKMVERIPLIRSIYSGIKQTLGVLLSDNSRSFREVVLVQFPKEHSYALAFVTNTLELADNQSLVTVFIPTTPNPTSGFVVNIDKKLTMKINLTVDEAFKYVISLGSVVGDDVKDKLKDKIHEFDANNTA